MTAKIDGTSGLLQQYDYQVLTTAFSYTFAAGTTVLVINPAGTLATGTITMPAAPADGMTISFSSTQSITALTVAGNTGQSIVGAPSTLYAGGAATFVYRLANTSWYAQLNTTAVGGTPTMTVYTSPATYTKPSTVKSVKVTLLSGGGSGSIYRGPAASGNGAGGGGGAGGFGGIAAPSITSPVAVTVGAGGAAAGPGGSNAYTQGNTGGSSSFGAFLSCTGGAGGSNNSGGASGSFTPSPTAIGFSGTVGTPSSVPGPVSGGGGNSFQAWGLGAVPAPLGPGPAPNPGTTGTGFGAGGSGAQNVNSPGLGTSGPGTAGYVIVEEFY